MTKAICEGKDLFYLTACWVHHSRHVTPTRNLRWEPRSRNDTETTEKCCLLVCPLVSSACSVVSPPTVTWAVTEDFLPNHRLKSSSFIKSDESQGCWLLLVCLLMSCSMRRWLCIEGLGWKGCYLYKSMQETFNSAQDTFRSLCLTKLFCVVPHSPPAYSFTSSVFLSAMTPNDSRATCLPFSGIKFYVENGTHFDIYDFSYWDLKYKGIHLLWATVVYTFTSGSIIRSHQKMWIASVLMEYPFCIFNNFCQKVWWLKEMDFPQVILYSSEVLPWWVIEEWLSKWTLLVWEIFPKWCADWALLRDVLLRGQ